jgi:hypothetical protein
VFARAVEREDGRTAFRLAGAYDPMELEKLEESGLASNVDRARNSYGRARGPGSLKRLARWLALPLCKPLAGSRALAPPIHRKPTRDFLTPVYGWFTEGFDTQSAAQPTGVMQFIPSLAG